MILTIVPNRLGLVKANSFFSPVFFGGLFTVTPKPLDFKSHHKTVIALQEDSAFHGTVVDGQKNQPHREEKKSKHCDCLRFSTEGRLRLKIDSLPPVYLLRTNKP